VSFTVNPGEIVCLVGESGSGKSVIAFTVMGLLAKSLKPTGGEILLEGENVLAATEERLRELRCTRMSMIFQEPMTALNPVMTCGEQIDEVLGALRTEYHDEIVEYRGRGMVWGIEFRDKDRANKVAKRAFELGLLIETSGPESEVVKLLPALTITPEELDEGLRTLTRAVRETV